MANRLAGKHPGVRWREHPSRKHGVMADRYYMIRYRVDGKSVEEGLGWSSQGWTVLKAANLRAELLENKRRGEGPRTLSEKRALDNAERFLKEEQTKRGIKDRLTFGAFFKETYLPASKSRKTRRSWRVEESLFNKWLKSVIGDKPLKDVAPIHLEKIKADMAKDGRAPRYVHYALAVVRQVFNYALTHNFYDGGNPVSKVKLPGGDNRRLRFLAREEAAALLTELAKKSHDVHDMALVSLHTGMRAGEVFGLTWADVDISKGLLTLRNTKNGKTRAAFMTGAVSEVFKRREKGAPSELVFRDTTGKRIDRISNTFARAVDALKLNEGITDRRHMVTFHTLRHTYASWHVENGTDLYLVKELLGHSNFSMTQRYAHLGENTLQAAVKRLDSTFKKPVKVLALRKQEKSLARRN